MFRKSLNTYYYKRQWKIFLLAFAALIGVLSVFYTNYIVSRIKIEERKTAKLWAESLKKQFQTDNDEFIAFLSNVLGELTSVPAIIVDQDGQFVDTKGLDSTKSFKPHISGRYYDIDYFKEQLRLMKAHSEPFEIDLGHNKKWYVYFKDSVLLTELKYFPYVQLSVIFIFLLVAYFAFSRSRRTEQNQVWVGMAKETAHQLGTPISALFAWMDYLQEKYGKDTILDEMGNDIQRLQMITDRFSKIGSAPVLEAHNVFEVIESYINYFKVRISAKIEFKLEGEPALAMMSVPLFEWVIENLCKNAVNAMRNDGSISFNISTMKNKVVIDIKDTGRGIPKLRWETIFRPGFTTRKRGWGLGLSLTRRIVQNYHRGEIFVKESEVGKGTTFRILILAAVTVDQKAPAVKHYLSPGSRHETAQLSREAQ